MALNNNINNDINSSDIQKRNFAVIEQIEQSIMIMYYSISPDTKNDTLQQDYIKVDQVCINPDFKGYSISFTSDGEIQIVEHPTLYTNKDGTYKNESTKKIFVKLIDPNSELSEIQLASTNYIGRSNYFQFWNLGFDKKDIEICINTQNVDFKLLDVSQFCPLIMSIYF